MKMIQIPLRVETYYNGLHINHLGCNTDMWLLYMGYGKMDTIKTIIILLGLIGIASVIVWYIVGLGE